MSNKNGTKMNKVSPKLFFATVVMVLATIFQCAISIAGEAQLSSSDGPADTVRKLPPEVEALFPEGAVWNQELWDKLQRSPRGKDPSLYERRIHQKIVFGSYSGICLDYHINLKLFGGKYYLGTVTAPIHEDHPRKKEFGLINWESLSPIDHVEVIHEWYVAKAKRFSRDEDYYWQRMAPVIKRQLIDGEGLILQRALIDVDENGTKEMVYRKSSYPYATTKSLDGGKSQHYSYFIYDKCPIKNLFNDSVIGRGIEPFYYKNELYYASGSGVLKGHVQTIGGKKAYVLGILCSFKEVKKTIGEK